MKKLIYLLAALLFIAPHILGQKRHVLGTIDWAKYSETYPQSFISDSTQIGIVTCIEARNDDFWKLMDYDHPPKNHEIIMRNAIKELGNNTFVNTFTETPAYFLARNITRANAKEYEYRVTEQGSKAIAPWSEIDQFDEPFFGVGMGGPGEMAVLGNYTAPYGHRITVEVRRKDNNEVVSMAIVEWVSIIPSLNRVFTIDHMNEFFNDLTHGWVNRNDKTIDLNRLKSTENSLIFLLNGSITNKSQMDYELLKNGKIVIPWRHNEFDNNFIWLKNLPHGAYELRFRYNVQPEHVGKCDFVIKPIWYQTTAIKIISGSLLAVFFGLIILVIILLSQKRKNNIEAEKLKHIQTELQVIRSQLNPHFIFNSLNSIQSLINKQDIVAANNYLSEFSVLLRNTITDIELEQLPLVKEVKILETYLNLEQLRFNFDYQITIEDEINIYETEIPSLLLQPLLENAVKHGLSDQKGTGELLLSFNRIDSNMIVVVSDNGKGFDATMTTEGFGLKLVFKRIQLLNNILKNSEIKYSINSDQSTLTEITLTFINWFA